MNPTLRMRTIVTFFGLLCLLGYVKAHGRLIHPPSRASMWRFGYENPADYNDNQGFCGGAQVQLWFPIFLFFRKKRFLADIIWPENCRNVQFDHVSQFQHQHEVNGGKCGICGDPYDALTKDHEAPDGKYANGIIVGEFQAGDIIDVTIEITANHKGYLVFKLCPNDNILLDPLQDCFDKYVKSIFLTSFF